MKRLIGCLLLLLATGVQASVLPEIYVTETPNALGGTYTVTINQPPLELSSPWHLSAWGISNQEATWVDTGLTGWSAWLIDDATWDSGVSFETSTPGDPIPLFSTGTGGIGDFTSVFGTVSQAAVYWNESYIGNPLVATSSNFNWFDGPAFSTAFAIISNQVEGESLSCVIGVGSAAPLNCTSLTPVPVPAAAWFLGPALAMLGWMRRRN